MGIWNKIYNFSVAGHRTAPTTTTEETHRRRPIIKNVGSEELPDITKEEVKAAVIEMKNRKSPGEDGVPIEAIKLGGDTLVSAITALFNKCLESEKIPKAWQNAVITLLQ